MKFSDSVSVIRGIGPRKAELLCEAGVSTVGDMVLRTPVRYEDKRQPVPFSVLGDGKRHLVIGRITSVSGGTTWGSRRSRVPVILRVEDQSPTSQAEGQGTMEVLFFNSPYIRKVLHRGDLCVFFGTATIKGGRIKMVHPEFAHHGSPEDVRGIFPEYSQVMGITNSMYRKFVRRALENVELPNDWIPEDLRFSQRLADIGFSIRNIHFPENINYLKMARYRILYEKFFLLKIGLLVMRERGLDSGGGAVINPEYASELLEVLPFDLTGGQKRVWQEISEDLSSDRPMNRLLQGDVGSGKTVVAALAMMAAVRSGYQAIMMAPTEILARQHFRTLRQLFEPLGVRVELLCSGIDRVERERILRDLEDGTAQVVTGTHSIIQETVNFHNPGIVITDEQHRFGVDQRRLLTRKGLNPDVLVMTATPIPRTLAVVFYQELQVSVIDTMPVGRRPVKTFVHGENERDRVYDMVEEVVKEGRQAYVVTPLIEPSENINARSATEVYEEVRKKFKELRVGLVHGGMKREVKDEVMQAFSEGEIDILVATVVIEVGIDVPNAAIMVIENCERFGLSQMHQLRGRVGRSGFESTCHLILCGESETSRQRAAALEECSDGFLIAEKDLSLRGPGEVFGTRQHGVPEDVVVDLVRHRELFDRASEAAEAVVAKDPGLELPENLALKKRVRDFFGENIYTEI